MKMSEIQVGQEVLYYHLFRKENTSWHRRGRLASITEVSPARVAGVTAKRVTIELTHATKGVVKRHVTADQLEPVED
jgi:hypothetical protein